MTTQLESRAAAQDVGLALMEEIVLDNGLVRNAPFTDYVIPTTLDMPDVTIAAWVEESEPGAPYGAKGTPPPPPNLLLSRRNRRRSHLQRCTDSILRRLSAADQRGPSCRTCSLEF